MIVLDSSAAVDFLVRRRGQGDWVAERLAADGDLHAPHLLDVEVLGALRRLTSHGGLPATRAGRALHDLFDLELVRYPHLPLVEAMWALRHALSASDAAFVALAWALDAELLTTDERLARAQDLPVTVVAP